jgi:hypothetical protein
MPAPRTLNPGSDLAPPIKPGPDVYIGLLVLSLIAQVAAALFLYMDYSAYPDAKPPKVQAPPSIGASGPAAAPAAGQPAGGGGILGGGGAAPQAAPQGAPPAGAGALGAQPAAPAAPPAAPPKK